MSNLKKRLGGMLKMIDVMPLKGIPYSVILGDKMT